MRIAMISDLENKWAWAGCEELWAATAMRALQAGHQVTFFQSRDSIDPQKILPLQKLGLRVVRQSIGNRFVRFLEQRVSWRLGSLAGRWIHSYPELHNFDPDVVFITKGQPSPPPEFLASLERSGVLKYPYLLRCHSSFLFGAPIDRSARERNARFYSGARRVLFVAERTRKDTEHLLAVKLPQARIVRNPVNLSDTSPLPMPGGSTLRIAAVGRVSMPTKGLDILLAALGAPQWKNRDWALSIIGDGDHLPLLKDLAEHYEIADRVAFKGFTADIRAVWAEHHLLALPSRNESAPLVVVEAMLCSRPTVANNVGGVCDWISEPETGFISEGIHIESFQAALERAWSARQTWEAMGRRAREKALQMIDPDPGNSILKILQEVVAERASERA